MKIAALQMDLVWEDRAANYATARRLAREARSGGAELILLPEMFATGFSMDPSVTAEDAGGETETFLRSLATELDTTVVGGFVRHAGAGKGVNIALTVGPNGDVLAEYAKIHLIATLGEDAAHVAGDAPAFFTAGEMTATCLICYDLRFPELFRRAADRCGLMLVMASWPNARQRHWDVLLQARAIENQCYVMGCNRVGQGGGLQFDGGSVIVDPMGQVLAHGGAEPGVVQAEVAPGEVARIRSRLPFLQDRRY